MPIYHAPLEDMRFVIHELADLASVQALPGCEEATPDLVDAILEEAGKFSGGVLAPINIVGDQQGSIYENGVVRTPDGFRDAYTQFIEGGWNGVPFDPEFDGQGLPWLVSTAVSEMWTAANMAFSLCPMLTQAAAEVVDAYGTDELKRIYLSKLVSGEWTGTMNLTEPQAGSDLARVGARATREGDHFRIRGQKIFITWGEHDLTDNIVHLVLGRTTDAPAGVRGLSLFLVPKFLPDENGAPGPRNDLRCVSIEHKLGIKASPTAVMSFGDNEGAIGYLVGQEHRGIEHMFLMMNNARLAVGLEGIGIADRAFQRARTYAFERVQGRQVGSDDPKPVAIAHHADVQRMLMSMKTRIEAARALAYLVAANLDVAKMHPDEAVRHEHDALVGLLTPVVKAWSTDIGIDVANTGIQVHGGMGYIEESGAPQHLRDARIASIYEGTNGIQANDLVGRKVARDKGAAISAFIATMRALDSELAGAASDDVAVVRDELRRGIDDLEEAVEWLVRTFPDDPNTVGAGSVYFLNLLGTVAGGWMYARSALIAERKLAAGEGNADFLRAKVIAARFYADHMLALTGGLKTTFVRAGDALEGLNPERHI